MLSKYLRNSRKLFTFTSVFKKQFEQIYDFIFEYKGKVKRKFYRKNRKL